MEAVRLNGICKSFKEKIDELSFRNKLISDELNTLKIKWKESENINKQLLFELESNIQSYKEMEEKYKASKDTLEKKIILGDNQEKNKFNLNESEPKDMDAKDKEIYELNGKLRKYQNEAKILKEKAHKASAELNKKPNEGFASKMQMFSGVHPAEKKDKKEETKKEEAPKNDVMAKIKK